MDVLAVICGVLLLFAVGFYVAIPLLTPHRKEYQLAGGTRVHQLMEQKEQLYATIKELEFDHQLGKLLGPDYQRLRKDLEGQAVAVLRDLDQADGRSYTELQELLEMEVRRRRKQPTATAQACRSCATPLQPQDHFCSHCGSPVPDLFP